MATKEFFPGIEKIKFEGKDSKNPMAFRYYDADKVIQMLYRLQKIKWMQVSNSCRKWVSSTTVSTM